MEAVFDFIDDHEQFSAHMGQSSWMTGGGKMTVDMDDQRGRSVGSHIHMIGSVLGVEIVLDEVVTQRVRPVRKEWATVGAPHLIVIGSYAMGAHLTSHADGTSIRVFIDYDRHRDDIEIDAVSLVKRGATSSRCHQFPLAITRQNRKHIEIGRGSRHAVPRGDDEPAATMQVNLMADEGVEVCEERSPRLGEVSLRTTDARRRGPSGDSSGARRQGAVS